MVRFPEDIDGCGCVRCQDIDPRIVQRPLSEALFWSFKLPYERASILIVFLLIGVGQFVIIGSPDEFLVPGAVIGVLSVFIGRGYVAVIGRRALGSEGASSRRAFRTVSRRVPAFVGAFVLVSVLLLALVGVIRELLAGPLRVVLRSLGVSPVAVDMILLLALAGGILFVLIKFCFVPEACFAGGYGPLAALRVSWTITTLHRRKAAAIVGGFAVLLSVGILLDSSFTGARSPAMLAFRYGESRIVIRSYGISTANGLRTLFDLFATTIYSGVFVHQYVAGILAR